MSLPVLFILEHGRASGPGAQSPYPVVSPHFLFISPPTQTPSPPATLIPTWFPNQTCVLYPWNYLQMSQKHARTHTHTHAHTHNTIFQGMVLHWWLSIDVYCWLDRHSAVAIAKLSLVKEIPPNWNWAHVVGFMSSLHLWHHGCSIWQFTVPSCNAVKQWRA